MCSPLTREKSHSARSGLTHHLPTLLGGRPDGAMSPNPLAFVLLPQAPGPAPSHKISCYLLRNHPGLCSNVTHVTRFLLPQQRNRLR